MSIQEYFCVNFAATDKLYATVVDMEHHLVRKDSSGFDMEEFFAHPERYGSTFSLKVTSRLEFHAADDLSLMAEN